MSFFQEKQTPSIQPTNIPVKEEKGEAHKLYVESVHSNICKVLSKSPPWSLVFLENKWIQVAKEQEDLPAM